MDTVVIEFFYYEPFCPSCEQEQYDIYVHNDQLVRDIQGDYGSRVSVNRVPFYSEEGALARLKYGFRIEDSNRIVINYETVIPAGHANGTYLRKILDGYLYESVHDIAIVKVAPSNSTVEIGETISINVTVRNAGTETESFNVSAYCNESLIETQPVTDLSPDHKLSIIFLWDTTNQTSGSYVIKAEAEPVADENNLANNVYTYNSIEVAASASRGLIVMFVLAFSFGFFETFSPCLIILLSFVMSYTISKTAHFKESFLKVMIFGAGFISATLLLAVAFGLVFLSMPTLQHSLTWIVCIFALVFGLNLLGILRMPSKMPFQSKPLIKKLASKYVITYAGLFLLGFVFYFLDPCIAPIFIAMMPLLRPDMLLFTLSVFCLGAIIPFVVIAFFAGSISKLARSTYRHRSGVRAVSGLILIGYALYLIVSYLLPTIK